LPESKPGSNSSSVLAAAGPLRVGVLNNPRSGGKRRDLGAVRKVLAAYPQVSQREVLTPADVAAALVDFSRQEVNVVVVNGGDGTIQAALTDLFHRRPFETLPLLAVLRAGTTSMTARDVGLQGSQEKALRRLLTWARTREGSPAILQRRVLRLQTAPDKEPLYGMFFGAAGIYQGIQFCRDRLITSRMQGEIGPGLSIAFLLLSIVKGSAGYVEPVPISIGLDGNPPEERDLLGVLVSTLERLFVGIRPYWGTKTGPLHYTAVSARPQHLIRALPSILRGRRGRYGTEENGYFSQNVEEVQLTFDSGYTLDGELFTSDLELGPLVVRDGGQALFVRL
jgi:hypothetical protein